MVLNPITIPSEKSIGSLTQNNDLNFNSFFDFPVKITMV
jgi:hypothetical protein